MSFCSIPKTLGSLGTAGELAGATADANSAYTGGLDKSNNLGSMGAAVVAATATAMQMERSPAFLRGLGMGLAPAAAVTQTSLNFAALQNATTSADKFAAGLGIFAGVTGTIAGLLPPSPAKVALTAASIAASAAQALVQAREPLEQAMLDALDQGTQAFNQFFYNRSGACDIGRIKNKAGTASTIPSPIILDLDGDGIIRTVGLSVGVNFDHAADGFAERTGWVVTGDGLLVLDRNTNGAIDSGAELFGSETLLPNGQRAVNGFEALKAFDVNSDGAIDANDTNYAQLRVWVDADANARTGEGELLTLESAGVKSISVAYTNSTLMDAQGNEHRQVGSYITTINETRAATDVWVQTDPTYSVPTEWVDVPEDIALLPDAQGYGKVRDLQQAMAMDATGELKTLVTAFTQASTPEERDALVTQIIYRWAGVQNVDPASRVSRMIYGNAIGDARKLEALEEFMGEEWVGVWCWGMRDPNPHGRAAPVLLQAWDELKGLVYGQLMSQSRLSSLFQSIAYHWDSEAESVVGDLTAAAQMLATRIESDRETGLSDLGDFLYSLKDMGLLNRLDMASFKAALRPLGADVAQTMDTVLKGRGAVVGPSESDDVLRGTESNDQLDAFGGNDLLLGHGGNDTLTGAAGSDILNGGAGDDKLLGGTGSDTYRFGRGDGNDTIIEDSWQQRETDRIELRAGVLSSEVRLERGRTIQDWQVSNDLKITIRDTGETLTVKSNFNESDRHAVEEIAFADGTVWGLEEIRSQVLLGGDANDELRGFSERDDLIEGDAGNDKLTGLSGDDTLAGGTGDDFFEGGTGSDTYRFGRGDGNDTIMEDSWQQGETDRIELKAGVLSSEILLERGRTIHGWQVSDDLKITIRDTGEMLTVKSHFNESNRHAIEEIVFADGTVWGLEEIRSQVLLGGDANDELLGFSERDDLIEGDAGNDKLTGLSGDDTLVGGAGGDILEGGTGSDTYRFSLGDGQDVINEAYIAGEDAVELAAGVTPADVTVRWTLQGDMAVTLPDGSKLTVRGQADIWSTERGIEQLRFADGTIWNRADFATRALAATKGDDAIVSVYQGDTIDGGAGNDQFEDLGGYDTYHFGTGDGQDTLADSHGRVLFKPGIDQNDVSFTRDGNDLIATVAATGDAVRVKNWLSSWQRIDRFEFDNDASLSAGDVLAKLNVSEEAEILYGSPGEDALVGTGKDSTLHGREGNDALTGGAGSDKLYGEAGDDTLDGGADRDWLHGGEGSNSYRVTTGMGLDNAVGASLVVANDTVVFAPGIRPEDVSVQLGEASWSGQAGDVGYRNLLIGIGGNDALVIRTDSGSDLGRGAVRHFRFDDGTEWTLAQVIARADRGKMGWQQRYWGNSTRILGSQSDDDIYDHTGESVTVQARGNNDNVYLDAGDDLVSAGSGDDKIHAGAGENLVAGEAGNDILDTVAGDDVIVFNHGDGHDTLRVGGGADTLSFGATITPAMLSVAPDRERRVVLLVDAGAGGSITLGNARTSELPGDLERIQFIDADGRTRVFDLAGWLQANASALQSATTETPLAFDGTGFELSGTVAPAGGKEAVAYAQSGNLFAAARHLDNAASEGDDVLYGTPDGDTLNARAGNDLALGLAGNDTVFGGDGDDLIHGGHGADVLEGDAGNDVIYGGWQADQLAGGTGNDQLFGEWDGDTYLYHPGHGEVIIDDDHRVLKWQFGGVIPTWTSESLALGDGWGGGFGGDGGFGFGFGGMVIDDDPNILAFGPGIRPQDLRYSEQNGDLVIEFANQPGDRVVLRGYAPGRATQTRSVDIIRFADGTEIVAESIEATGKTEIAGDDGGRMFGTSASDTLIGGDGDDVLVGQGGADRLVGGAGSDTYRIQKQSGARPTETLIAETWREQDSNRIEVTGIINADDLRLEFDGRDLLLRLNDEGDVVRFAGFDPRAQGMQAPVSEIILSWWGVSLSFDELMARGVRYGDRTQGIHDINIGDGEVFIENVAAPDNGNVLRFGTGIDPEALRTHLRFEEDGNGGHSLRISYGGDGDILHLTGFNPNDALAGGHAVDRFEFGDGTVWDFAALISGGFLIEGDEQSNELTGTNLSDRLHGGGDNDALSGAAGDDAYVFNKDDGIDTIIDSGASDFNYIRFGTDIRPEDIRHEWDGTTLILHYSDVDAVRIDNYHGSEGEPVILALAFEDGTVISLTEQMNRSPVAGRQMDDTTATEDQDFSLILPANLFSDPDASDEIQVVGRLANGDPLPTWLSFDPVSRTLSGKPANDDVGKLAIMVEGRDHFGAAAIVSFRITVQNTNDAPEAGMPLSDLRVLEDSAFSFTLPADSFRDVDVGDALACTATLANGDPLPDWLSFNPLTGTFSGTPASAGNYAVRVTATDLAGAQASQSFALAVESVNVNQSPVTAPDAVGVIEDRKLFARGNVLANDRDPEGERLRVAEPGIRRGEYGTLNLLSNGAYVYELDECSTRLQGLGADEKVTESFTYVASDGTNRGKGVLTVTVQGTNDTPDLVRCLSNVQLARGKEFAWQLPAGSFKDVDRNDTLRYVATLSNGKGLPSWLRFDAATQTFSGTAPTNARSGIDVRVIASDGHGECSTASDDFRISFGSKTVTPTAIGSNQETAKGAAVPSSGSGAGTSEAAAASPGQSGQPYQPDRQPAADRSDDQLERFLDGYQREDLSARIALPALDQRWLGDGKPWGALAQAAGQTDHAQAGQDAARRWAELTHALNQLDAERRSAPFWSDITHGADLGVLAGSMQGASHGSRGGVDDVSLACATGTQLKYFNGLREGLGRLPW